MGFAFGMDGIHWHDTCHLEVNGTHFHVIEGLRDLIAVKGSAERMLLGKTRPMVERYLRATAGCSVRHVFELGIFKGGSAAFLHALFQPRKLVAIDFKRRRSPHLDAYIERQRCQDALVPYYGVDQSDRSRLSEILRREFPAGELDLVVDDASHWLEETTVSFDVLFPRLRAGGLYIIEDWSWAHAAQDVWQMPSGLWSDKSSLAHLVFEIVLACASTPGLVEQVVIDRDMAIVTRGECRVDTQDFAISASYATRGRAFPPML